MKVENYYNLVFGSILLLLVSVSLLMYWNVKSYMNEVSWIGRSNQVIAQLEKILSTVKDAETGHRGFQLTGDTIFLRPYNNSVKSIYSELSLLDSLFVEDEIQRQRSDSLHQLIDKQYRIINTILENEERVGRYMNQFEIDLLIVGRENMDRIRGICSKMASHEATALAARSDQEYNLKNITPFSLLIYCFIGIGVAAFMYAKLNHELRQRRKTESELMVKMQELDQKEKRYQSLFERSIDPIFQINDEFKIIDANPSLESLFKYSGEDVRSLKLDNLFQDNEHFRVFRERLHEFNHVKDFEVTLKTRDGKKLIGLINCVFINDAFDQPYYQGIIHDITVRKKSEREMLMAEKLSTTGRIARTIAHEIRNPLTNLNLAVDQLKEEFTEQDSTIVYTDIIERNLGRIEVLISELLRSSRPKELQLQEIALSELIEETIDLVRDRARLNQIKIKKDFEFSLPIVKVDKELMKIALVNIMVNAIEAMKPGEGILEISTYEVNGHITLIISDNGVGIPEEDLNNLFDPFYSAKQGGMGLGLTSTQTILRSHQIDIEVTSKKGIGTSFHLLFSVEKTGKLV